MKNEIEDKRASVKDKGRERGERGVGRTEGKRSGDRKEKWGKG